MATNMKGPEGTRMYPINYWIELYCITEVSAFIHEWQSHACSSQGIGSLIPGCLNLRASIWAPGHNGSWGLVSFQPPIWRVQRGALLGGRFKKAYELLNLRALKFSPLDKIHIFQCMGKIFCVEFQRYPLKFHTKYLTHTLKGTIFIQHWNFKSS